VSAQNIPSDLVKLGPSRDIALQPGSIWGHAYQGGLKRAVDIVCAILALAFLWPLLLLIAALVRLDSRGPALFVQERIGKNGRPFRLLKFRTMSHDLDDSAHRMFMQAFVRGEVGHASAVSSKAVFKPYVRSEVTQVGSILRKTSLDELPQLVNVLTGSMSLVGPRPNVLWEVEAYQAWHRERLNVLPGITGLAQVNGRSGIDFDTIARYDVQYVRSVSLALDVRILLKTVLLVIGCKWTC
jgi:lipopolysaccharide/colanic/teichoic acid biosynthesis glycosyltransferase